MKNTIIRRFFVTLSLLAVSAIYGESVFAEDAVSLPDLNNAARFLAGLDPSHPDAPSAKHFDSSSWRSHASAMNKEWARYEERRLDRMSEWAATETVPHTRPGGVVRYMFSGPDILHARRMFPEASTYVLCGLEPLGPPPDLERLSGHSTSSALSQIRKSLEESLRLSFFITKDMQRELYSGRFAGIFPIITLYLARSGLPVRGYEYLELKEDGSLVSLGTSPKDATGFRVEAGNSADEPVEVYYFKTDLRDSAVEKSGFIKFLETRAPGAAYLKAASYVPHSSSFKEIVKHLLENSHVIVQDDSGVPLKRFDGDDWGLTHYGTYTRPISLFSNRYQSDLRAAYRDRDKVKPLKFGTGYKYRVNESNLMRALRKNPIPPPEEKAAGKPAGAGKEKAEEAAGQPQKPQSSKKDAANSDPAPPGAPAEKNQPSKSK